MINKRTLSTYQNGTGLINASKRGHLIGLLAVLMPFLSIGIIGDYLGADTSITVALTVTLAYLLAIVIGTTVLKKQGSGWRDLGLARPKSWPKTILIAVAALVAVVAGMIVSQIVVMNIPGLAIQPSDQSDYNPLTGNLPMLLYMVAAAWTTVAFGEEMVFRAFLTFSLAGIFQDLKAKWALAVAGSSLLFGLAHFDWGLAGMIDTAIMGLILGAIYLKSGRNLWITIIAHALGNTLKFILIYAGTV